MGSGSGQGYPAGKGVVRGFQLEKGREWDFHPEKGSGEGFASGKRVRSGISIWDQFRERDFHLGSGSGEGFPFGIGTGISIWDRGQEYPSGIRVRISIWDQDHPPGAAPRAPSRAEFQEFQPSPSSVPGLIINPKSRKIPLQPLSGKTKSRSRSRPAPPCPPRATARIHLRFPRKSSP